MTPLQFPESDSPRNPDTYAAHRRESLWQIWLPIGATIGILVLLVILIWASEYGGLSKWAAAATILLVIPLMFVGLIVLVINVGGVYVSSRVYSRLSPIMFRGQIFLQRMEGSIFRATDTLVEPFIKVRQFWARMRVLRRKRVADE